MTPSDDELLERFGGGDAAAFEEIVRRWDRRILNLAWRLTGDLDEAQDVRQGVFLRAFTGLARHRGRGRLGTWLYRVTLNLCRDARRTDAVEERWRTTRQEPAPRESTGEACARTEEERALMRAIAALPDRERETVVLKHYHDLTFREVGVVLGVPATTVKSRLARALERLRWSLDGIGRAMRD